MSRTMLIVMLLVAAFMLDSMHQRVTKIEDACATLPLPD